MISVFANFRCQRAVKIIFVFTALMQALNALYLGNVNTWFVKRHVQTISLMPSEKIVQSRTDNEMTLRKFISHADGFHLAMAPAFFGYYAYFGALIALEEGIFPHLASSGYTVLPNNNKNNANRPSSLLKSVSGASAGAMAAVLAASGIKPRTAAEFASTLTFSSFADPPGFGAFLKGNLFESILLNFLSQQLLLDLSDKTTDPSQRLRLETAQIPVAVSAFDLSTMSGRILTEGCIARAARASATFPGLFQPVLWNEEEGNNKKGSYFSSIQRRPVVLIDGGVTDTSGYLGLSAIVPSETNNKRVVNLVVGNFHLGKIPGPTIMRSHGVQASEVVSISIQNSPKCGPWAMENGPIAVEAVRRAFMSMLDVPMHLGDEDGHYILTIDTTEFIDAPKK